MDLAATAEHQAFRAECRAWLIDNLPWDYGIGLPPMFDDLAEEVAFGRRWQQQLAAAGYVGVGWPVEFGGRAADPVFSFIVQEELARARAPELVGRIGVNLVGPCLLAHGTDAQKSRWLRGILDAQQLMCQLFSEPEAGSDLASLRTRAEPCDGGWRLHGTKVWTSYAQFADWGLCLARTDPDTPKRQGITALMVDMRSPGVQVRPLRQITAESDFNEVVFDGTFVGHDQVIGTVNGGWGVAGSVLSGERGTNPRQLVIHSQLLEELVLLADELGTADDPRISADLAQAYAEVRLFHLQNWRTLSKHAHGRRPGPETATAKLYWSEMSQRLHATALRVLADRAPLWRGAGENPADGRWQRSWLYYRAASIFAGTNEIQRNIIAERTQGLPRDLHP